MDDAGTFTEIRTLWNADISDTTDQTYIDLRSDISDTANVLRSEWRSDIGDSLELKNVYGSMGFSDSSVVISCTEDTYHKITNADTSLYTVHINHGLTMEGDSVQVLISGNYLVMWDLSYSGTNTDLYHIEIFVSSIGQEGRGETHRNMTTNNMGTSGAATILSLAANDWLEIRIKNTENDNDPTVYAGNFTIKGL